MNTSGFTSVSASYSRERLTIGTLVSSRPGFTDTITISIVGLDSGNILCVCLDQEQTAAVADLLTKTMPHLINKEDQYRDSTSVRAD